MADFRIANLTVDGRMAGPQLRILRVAERLREHHIETVVIIPREESKDLWQRLLRRNIHVHRCQLHRLTRDWPHVLKYVCFFFLDIFSIYWVLKREDIRLLHCNFAWEIKGLIAGKLAGAKVLWHLQDTQTPWLVKMLFPLLASLLCDGFIVAGDRVRRYYLEDGHSWGKRVCEIQAPVDTARFAPNCVVKDRRVGGIRGMKIVTVGNVNPDKGFEYFIEMAKILTKGFPSLLFFIVGPYIHSQRGYWERLHRMVADYRLENLVFCGQSDDVASILKAADIFVCSSITEASPMAVWEAMAMEKAIVSTDVGDIGRFIKDGECGFVVTPANAQRLAEKVSVLIKDSRLRRSFGKNARVTAIRELDIERCVDKHRKLYMEYMGYADEG